MLLTHLSDGTCLLRKGNANIAIVVTYFYVKFLSQSTKMSGILKQFKWFYTYKLAILNRASPIRLPIWHFVNPLTSFTISLLPVNGRLLRHLIWAPFFSAWRQIQTLFSVRYFLTHFMKKCHWGPFKLATKWPLQNWQCHSSSYCKIHLNTLLNKNTDFLARKGNLCYTLLCYFV